jgi:hypothetical protein
MTNTGDHLDEASGKAPPLSPEAERSGVDVSLLRTSLALTPWERMRANDDALNFAESLRAAMIKRNAKPL